MDIPSALRTVTVGAIAGAIVGLLVGLLLVWLTDWTDNPFWAMAAGIAVGAGLANPATTARSGGRRTG